MAMALKWFYRKASSHEMFTYSRHNREGGERLTNNTTNGDNQAENLAIIYVWNALSLIQKQKLVPWIVYG